MSDGSEFAVARASQFGGAKTRSYYWHIVAQLGLLIPVIVFAVVIEFNAPHFLRINNILQILRQSAAPGIMASAVTLVVVAGRFDLSIGSILSLVSVLVVSLYQPLGPALAVSVGLLAGMCAGAVNGFVVGILNLNSIIATLGSLSIIQGLTLIYTGGRNVQSRGVDPNGWFSFLGRSTIWGIPVQVYELLIVAIVLEFGLKRSTFGRRVIAVGGGEVAANFSGINTRLTIFATYVVAGFVTAFAAVVFSAHTIGAQNDAGSGYELTVLAAIILGGASINGGAGSVLRSVGGVVILTFIQNGLVIVGLPFYTQWIVTWAVIVIAVAADLAVQGRRPQ